MSSYFIIGMFSTLSFNAVLSQMAEYYRRCDQFPRRGLGETTMGEVITKG